MKYVFSLIFMFVGLFAVPEQSVAQAKIHNEKLLKALRSAKTVQVVIKEPPSGLLEELQYFSLLPS